MSKLLPAVFTLLILTALSFFTLLKKHQPVYAASCQGGVNGTGTTTLSQTEIQAGDTLVVTFDNPLLPNDTYFLTIGATSVGGALETQVQQEIQVVNGHWSGAITIPSGAEGGTWEVQVYDSLVGITTSCSINAPSVTIIQDSPPPPSDGECRNEGQSCNESTPLCDPVNTYCDLSIAYPEVKSLGGIGRRCIQSDGVYTCTSGTPSQQGPGCVCITESAEGPYPPPEVFCYENRGTNPDFHSLRPNQASISCTTYNSTINSYYCANDLVTRQTLNISYDEEQIDGMTSTQRQCDPPDENGVIHCNYVVEGTIPVSVDLSDAQLPIMGLTEGPYLNNSQNRNFTQAESASLMNEYVSWYMNGVIGRAEENILTYDERYPLTVEQMEELEGEYNPIDTPEELADAGRQETIPSDKTRYMVAHEDMRKLIVYSGPLRKLLPWRIQNRQRVRQIEDAEASQINTPVNRRQEEIGGIPLQAPENSRHNQIAACSVHVPAVYLAINVFNQILGRNEGVSSDIAFPCYAPREIIDDIQSRDFFGFLNVGQWDFRRHRLIEWLRAEEDHKLPPADEQYDDFVDYWRSYRSWRGDYCTPTLNILGLRVYWCIDDPRNPNYWSNLFYYIPFSSTEDRLGFAEGDTSLELTPQPGGSVRITAISFDPEDVPGQDALTPDGKRDLLYFPHMLEDAQLADLLQSTYKPFGQQENYGNFNTGPYNTGRCEPLESRWNVGDDLFGEHNNPEADAIPIIGDVTYTGEFSCDFTPIQQEVPEYCQGPSYIDNRCDTDWAGTCCDNPESDPNDSCTHSWTEGWYQCNTSGGIAGYSVCQVDVMTATSIYNTVPYVEENWYRYVNGPMSIFKRMFPRTGPEVEYETPVEEIEDIPARTFASYDSGDPDVEVLAGDPSQGRTGENAEMFFPHIGSIYDYFLKGIQKALRPRAISSFVPGVGQSPDAPLPDDVVNSFESIACPTTVPPAQSHEEGIICEANCRNIPDSAVPARWLGSFKEGVVDLAQRWVATGGENSLAEECYNDVVTRSLAAGVNPIYSLAIWIQESGASNYNSNVTYCSPDAPSQTVQDFGINIPSLAGNFDAQITRFLRLPYFYPNEYEQCFVNGCNLATFSRVYQQGASGACEMNSSAIRYAQKTLNTMSLISPSCQPKYPTDTTCQ